MSDVLVKQYSFSSKKIDCFFNADFFLIKEKVQKENIIFITDENIFNLHADKFNQQQKIVIKAGEEFKNQDTVNYIINKLIDLKADRQTFVIGVGGGVVTDVAGFAASVYMRGIQFAFVPTSILAMVDAAIGGKNGIDVGIYKNIVGVINHPEFLWYDYSFLETLPHKEWINGFAEIIKDACIKDKAMFQMLQQNSIEAFQSSKKNIADLIQKNVDIKYNIVAGDEKETGDRKLLNFGHTIGHAIENDNHLAHGHAVSIGMAAACKISEQINNFSKEETKKVMALIQQYHLPVSFNYDKNKTWSNLQLDKKKAGSEMNFIVLNKIGDALVKKIPLHTLQNIFNNL